MCSSPLPRYAEDMNDGKQECLLAFRVVVGEEDAEKVAAALKALLERLEADGVGRDASVEVVPVNRPDGRLDTKVITWPDR